MFLRGFVGTPCDDADMDVLAVILLIIGLGAGAAAGYLLSQARAGARVARLSAELDAEKRTAAQALEAERARAAERVEAAKLTESQVREMFSALSSDALHRNNRSFLELAQATLKQATTEASGDLTKRQQAIEALVSPLRESLGKVEKQILDVEKSRTEAYAQLRTQVEAMGKTSEGLRAETAQLVSALRAPQVRGRWGELQLRRVVEVAGMLEHCDFTEQATTNGDDGVLRPDLVVQLAGGKNVVVDAKVPFLGFLEAMEARDDDTRAKRLAAHARHLRDHIDKLAAKAYWERFEPAPEFVVMFVPADTFLQAAFEQDPSLQEHAFERNVVIATPATLVALLRTIGYAWRQEALAANARQVFDLGKELHGRLSVMGEHVDKLGRQLNSAVDSYNKTVSSLESRVLVSARKLADLKVVDADLASPRQIEVVARQVQAPELLASATDALVALPHQPEPAGKAARRHLPEVQISDLQLPDHADSDAGDRGDAAARA